MTMTLSLRGKLLVLTSLVLVVFTLAVGAYVKIRFAAHLTEQLLTHGIANARFVAELSADAMINRDVSHLEHLAHSQVEASSDLAYIFMLDADGRVLGHSFNEGFPADLLGINQLPPGAESNVREVQTPAGPVYDILVPVLDRRVGSVRLGVFRQPVIASVETLVRQLLTAILLLGLLTIVAALPATRSLSRPIAALTKAVEALGRGERRVELPAARWDEIGILTKAFKTLIANLDQAENHLKAQLSFMQVLIDDIPIPVFYKDMQGRMLGCNRAYCGFYGGRLEDYLGNLNEERQSPEVAQLHRLRDQELIRTAGATSYELPVVSADGSTRQVIFQKALFRDEQGRPAGIIGVMQDVTQQRQLDQLKSDFVSTVAHEFQTPLATILGFVELIQEGILVGKDYDEAMGLISQKVETLSGMVNELLDISRMETGRGVELHPVTFDLSQLIRDVVTGFAQHSRNHQFKLEIPDLPLLMTADQNRLEEVLENLLSNAVKYSEKGGEVRVQVTLSGPGCLISVADDGIGMTAEQVRHAFDKFYRADTSNTAPSGTGLGLYICQTIIQAHEGRINIDSTLGKGTKVTIALPWALDASLFALHERQQEPLPQAVTSLHRAL